jgi:gluconate 2-dehydrogenase subunit 3-like protein
MTVPPSTPLLVFTPAEARTLSAMLERLFPADENGPGATEIGALDYLDRALSGPYAEVRDTYRLGLFAVDQASVNRFQTDFAHASTEQQEGLLAELEAGTVKEFSAVDPKQFFELVRGHLQEGLFSDPWYGGNRGKAGRKSLSRTGQQRRSDPIVGGY